MVNDVLVKFFKGNNITNSKLNFTELINLMGISEFNFIGGEFRHGFIAFATGDNAFFNIDYLEQLNVDMVYFIILHEYCHLKKLKVLGKERVVKELSNTNFVEFSKHIIDEEILADRFARIYFFRLNNKMFPILQTQQLELIDRQKEYCNGLQSLFGTITDENSYDSLVNYYTLDYVG